MNHRDFHDCLERAFSSERLNPYQERTQNKQEACQAYFWNLALCESLYPVLNAVEVVVRNELDECIAELRGNQWWFRDDDLLGPKENKTVEKTHQRLTDEDSPIETPRRGHYIADLSFGFWTGLLHKYYERGQTLWPTLLTGSVDRSPFPKAPKKLRKRQAFFVRVDKIRRLRNRVFHHEPLWNRDNLEDDYQTILEVIGWVDSDLETALSHFCRFPAVYEDGWDSNGRVRQIAALFEEGEGP